MLTADGNPSDPQHFADIADELYALGDAARVAESIARIGRDAAGCSAAAVSLIASGRRIQPAAGTSQQAYRAEQLQGVLGEGPGRTAALTRELVVTEELSSDERWPLWAHDAATDPRISKEAKHARAAA